MGRFQSQPPPPLDPALAPKDKFHLAYSIHFLLGTGYLVPWNAFITAIDYFEYLYPNAQIDRLFAVVYMLPAVFCVFLLTFWGRRIPAVIRVNVGLFIFILMLILVPIMDTVFIKGGHASHTTLLVTVIAAALSGVADALMQGSIVGSTGELPGRYMQALMAGTAASGVLVSIMRMITKGALPQTDSGLRASANLYFIVSAVIMVACTVCYNTVDKLPIMRYYSSLKVSSMYSNVLLEDENMDNEKTNLIGRNSRDGVYATTGPQKSVSFMHVWKQIQGLALSVALIYVITLSIFPGHITEDLHSTVFRDWYPILLTACYNVFDLAGKLLPGWYTLESKLVAIWGCVARVLFYPLFYLCLHGPKFLHSEFPVILLTCLLGLSNGYLTTVVMIMAPKNVPLQEAEVAGFIMVIFLLLGLALGSVLEWVWVL